MATVPDEHREGKPSAAPQAAYTDLAPEHAEELAASAVAPEVAAGQRVHTAFTRDDLPQGAQWLSDEALPAIVYPMTQPDGTSSWQVKPVKDSVSTKYVSPARDDPIDTPCKLSNLREVEDPEGVLIVEGVKQALAALSWAPVDWSIYRICGIWGWSESGGDDGTSRPTPLLSVVTGHPVVIVPDQDARTKIGVHEGASALGEVCDQYGAVSVRFARLPGAGSDGLDDILGREPDPDKRRALVAGWIEHAAKRPADLSAKQLEKMRAERAAKLHSAESAPTPGQDSDADPAAARWTDSSVARRFVGSVEGRLCWTASTGFMHWTGRVWKRYDAAEVLELLRRFARTEVAREAADPTSNDLGHAVVRMETKALKAARELTMGLLARDFADFDTDPDIAVVRNGVIDLPTGRLMPHDPSRLVTKMAGDVAYVPGTTHPDWDKALEALTPEAADYIQVRFGHAFTGHRPDDDVNVHLHGPGGNGKSTVIDAVVAALGQYAVQISDKVLLGDTRDHPTELMDLKGARLAYFEELPEKRHLNMQRIKKISGTRWITARYVHKDNVEFPQTWDLFFTSNYDLLVDEVDRGSWRRLVRIPFPHSYKKAHEPLESPSDRHGDPNLRAAVVHGEAQQQAVLAWLVEGAHSWYQNDRTMPEPPAPIAESTHQWRKDNDVVLAFAEDLLVSDKEGVILLKDLLTVFNSWLTSRGSNRWTMGTLRSRLDENDWLKIAGAHLTRRERRDPETLSRPELRAGDVPLPQPPVQGQYVVGVRFRTIEDDLADLEALNFPGDDRPDGGPDGGPTPPAGPVPPTSPSSPDTAPVMPAAPVVPTSPATAPVRTPEPAAASSGALPVHGRDEHGFDILDAPVATGPAVMPRGHYDPGTITYTDHRTGQAVTVARAVPPIPGGRFIDDRKKDPS